VNKNVPVRISGWLLYDYEHVSVIGSQRASVWEIHPITKIEVKWNGQWVNLGQYEGRSWTSCRSTRRSWGFPTDWL